VKIFFFSAFLYNTFYVEIAHSVQSVAACVIIPYTCGGGGGGGGGGGRQEECGNAFFHQTTNAVRKGPVVLPAFLAALVVRWKNAFPQEPLVVGSRT
jgi:hypothetical protein